MRAIGIILLFISNLAFASLPEARDEYINDYANLIQNGYERELREKLEDTEYYSGVEITVITIKSFSKYDSEFSSWESFATALFNKWGVGNRPENNGVMLLAAREGRKIRIELGAGYPKRFDSIMKSIIEETIYPQFKRDNYTTGITQGVDEIVNAVTRPIKRVNDSDPFDWSFHLGNRSPQPYLTNGVSATVQKIMESCYWLRARAGKSELSLEQDTPRDLTQ